MNCIFSLSLIIFLVVAWPTSRAANCECISLSWTFRCFSLLTNPILLSKISSLDWMSEEDSLGCSMKNRNLLSKINRRKTSPLVGSTEGSLTAKSHLSLTTINLYRDIICFWCSSDLQNSPEGLYDVGGDGSSSLVGVGLPGQGDAVLGHVCDDGFVGGTRQLEGLCGLSRWRICALWVLVERTREEEGANLITLQHTPLAVTLHNALSLIPTNVDWTFASPSLQAELLTAAFTILLFTTTIRS